MTWMLLVACQVDPLVLAGIAPALPPPPSAVSAAAPLTAVEPVAEAPAPASFSPISVPQGPREDGGVRWKGVGGKFQGVTQEDREMFVGEDP